MILMLIDRLAFSWLVSSCFLTEGAEFAAHFLVIYMKFLCRIDWGACWILGPGRWTMWFPSSRPWTNLPASFDCKKLERPSSWTLKTEYQNWIRSVCQWTEFVHESWFLLCSCLLLNIDEPWWAQLRWRLDSTTTPVSTPSLKLSSMRSRPMNSLCNQPQVWTTSPRILDDCSIHIFAFLDIRLDLTINLSTWFQMQKSYAA